MFRRKFKNNLKNKLICNNKIINNIFNLIIIIINFDNKLYKKVIKKNTINFRNKYLYIIACKEKFIIEQLEYIVLNRLI